jgi:hypothetical protein
MPGLKYCAKICLLDMTTNSLSINNTLSKKFPVEFFQNDLQVDLGQLVSECALKGKQTQPEVALN